MKLFEVLAIGDANIDITLKIDHVPKQDDKVLGTKVMEQIGGTVANSACVCGSLGLKTATLAKVGTDRSGIKILDEYTKYNVDTRYVIQRDDYESSQAIIMLDNSGEKALIFVPSEPYGYEFEELQTSISNSQYVYTMPGNIEKFVAIAEIAKNVGSKVVVDIEPTIVNSNQDLQSILKGSDIVFFNEEGFKKATGNPASKETILPLVDEYQLDGVVVTLGAKGVLAVVNHEFAQFNGFKVPVIDTTGAGDTFNASFLYTQIKGMPLSKALKFACASAAISIGDIGAKGNVPTQLKIADFLASGHS